MSYTLERPKTETLLDIWLHLTDVQELEPLMQYVEQHGADWGFTGDAIHVIDFPRNTTQELLNATKTLRVYKITFPDGAVLFHHRTTPEGIELGSDWYELLSESRLSIQKGRKE
jgi:hypothetical protein